MALPKPPINTMTDFVVFCFVTLVVAMLFLLVIGTFVVAIIEPDRDLSTILNVLANVMTTLIGALVGFIAGKGSGRAEVHDEQDELERKETIRAKDKEQ